jgi:hypothetical protein
LVNGWKLCLAREEHGLTTSADRRAYLIPENASIRPDWVISVAAVPIQLAGASLTSRVCLIREPSAANGPAPSA